MNTDIKFLHIKRRNLLASLFSYKRAFSQDQWITADIDFKTKICVSECERYFKATIDQQKHFDNLFKRRSFQIVYEDIALRPQKILIDLQKFIKVSPVRLETEMVKNKNKKLSEKITNFAELKSHFKNSIYSDYFNE